jgi:sortase A
MLTRKRTGCAIVGHILSRRWFRVGGVVVALILLATSGAIAQVQLHSVGATRLVGGLQPTLAVGREQPVDWLSARAIQQEIAQRDAKESAPAPSPTSLADTAALAAMPQAADVPVGEAAALQPSPTPTPLAPASAPPTRLVAPTIHLDASIIPVGWHQEQQNGKTVSVWDVAEYAVGWQKNSALPGQGGNIVLAAHSDTKGEVFRYLDQLKDGDLLTLYADGRAYTYAVESHVIVQEKGVSEAQQRDNARWIGRFPDERVTLVTCWPYPTNTHRYIVIAKPVR